MTPEKSVEDAVKKPVEMEAVYIWLPPDTLQRRSHVGAYNVQHLSERKRQSDTYLYQACDNDKK